MENSQSFTDNVSAWIVTPAVEAKAFPFPDILDPKLANALQKMVSPIFIPISSKHLSQ